MKKHLAFMLFAILLAGPIVMKTAFAGETWYVGEGIEEGDYFRYKLCHFDYKKCTEFEMDFWVEGRTENGDWKMQVLVIDGDKKVRGDMQVGRVAPEPLGGSENLADYRAVYKSSLVWLSGFATQRDPKDLTAQAWGKIGSIGGMAVGPLGQKETITVPAGVFETELVGWHKGADNKIWIKDNFPYPIMALTFVDVTTGTIPVQYKFELLEYGNTANPPDFLEAVSTPTVTEEKCPSDSSFVRRQGSLDSGKMIVDYRYSPENPQPGCKIQWNLDFNKWFAESQFESDVHYNIFVVDDNDKLLRSFAQEEGKTHLFTSDGKDLLFMDVKEPNGIAHYVIHVYGTGPDGVAPNTEKSGTLNVDIAVVPEFPISVIMIMAFVLAMGVVITRFKSNIPSLKF